MSQHELLPIHKNIAEANSAAYPWKFTAAMGALAMASVLALGEQQPNTVSEEAFITPALSSTIYKIGGTGDPNAQHLPRIARPEHPAHPITYPADAVNLPQSAKIGTERIVRTVTSDDDTVIGWSQGAWAASNAAASGKMRAAPTMILTSNPSHARVPGHHGQGIANFASYYGFPQLQARSTRNYDGDIVEQCAEGDAICDFDPRIPLGVAAMNYWNIHLGHGPFNYSTVDPDHAIVTKRGNTTYIYYLKPRSTQQPGTRNTEMPQQLAPPISKNPAVVPSQPVSAPISNQTFTAPASQSYVAPIVTHAQESVDVVADSVVQAAPQLTQQVRQVERQVSTHLNNLAKIIPGLPR